MSECEGGNFMSHVNFDFLTQSLFFGPQLELGFSSVSDAELKKELQQYREYVLLNFEEIKREICENPQKIAVTIESFSQRPKEKILKQLALYVDNVVISDPLFEMTEEINDATKAMNQYLDIKDQEKLDRGALVDALKYMKDSTLLVACNYVKYVPISYLHEAPLQVPLTYDKDRFGKSIPESIMELLRKNVKVYNLVTKNGKMYVEMEKKLTKGTGLWIEFPECNSMSGEFVQYYRPEIVKCDDSTRTVVAKMTIPEQISQYEFDNWLDQSVNRACLQLYQDTYKELALASSMNTMYLTQSVLRAQLMAQEMETISTRSKIANMALKLDVPVLENSKIQDIISIRNDYGESFRNFRVGLGGELLQLSGIKDEEQLKQKLQEVTYEINEVYINQINREMSSLVKSFGFDVMVTMASLIANVYAGQNNMLSAAGAMGALYGIGSGMKDSLKLFSNIKTNPGFFLWKLNKRK